MSTLMLQTAVQPPGPAVVPGPPVHRPGVPIVPTQDQLAKLRSELDVVQGNVRVMSEMLTELTPSNVDSSDLELLQVMSVVGIQLHGFLSRIIKWVNYFFAR